MGMIGIVSALAMSPDGILASGTVSRWIGLYDGYGRGGTRGIFETRGNDRAEKEKWAGTGITQLIWSDCGNYLCVAERESNGIGVWDIRGSGRRLAWLQGRVARTNQRLEVGVMRGEVWAGGTDGIVRIWEGLGQHEGDIGPAWQFHAHDGIFSSSSQCVHVVLMTDQDCSDAVCATILHPSGAVLATCSGQRHTFQQVSELQGDSDDDNNIPTPSSLSSPSPSSSGFSTSSRSSSTSASTSTFDNSLKVWAL